MAKKQPKKQPINVQLSKDDLKELLTVLKDFIAEELQGVHRVHDHRLDCHNQRIISLEGKERRREKRDSNQVLHCAHDDKLDCIEYSKVSVTPLFIVYKCKWCKREDRKMAYHLTRKEKKALRKLGVEL